MKKEDLNGIENKLGKVEDELYDIKNNTKDVSETNYFLTVSITIGLILLFVMSIAIFIRLGDLTPQKEIIPLVEGKVQRINSNGNLMINGQLYDFCEDDINLVNIGDYVRIIRERNSWDCGEIEIISINEDIKYKKHTH